jgi:hypothetical protein
MANPVQNFTFVFSKGSRDAAFALALVCSLMIIAPRPASGQTFRVLHDFTDGVDGASPYVGVTMDSSGNLYGTTG